MDMRSTSYAQKVKYGADILEKMEKRPKFRVHKPSKNHEPNACCIAKMSCFCASNQYTSAFACHKWCVQKKIRTQLAICSDQL